MSQFYVNANDNLVIENKEDPITYDDLKHPHPRGIITLRRSNNKPYPMLVDSFLKLVKTQSVDPFTRQKFKELDIQRALLYKACMDTFPKYDMSRRNCTKIFNRWKKTFTPDHKLDPTTLFCYKLEARGFLQPEDITHIFESGDKSSSLNREKAEEKLKDQSVGSWLLRYSSLIDDEYNWSFVLSIKLIDKIKHYCIVHRLGEGFFLATAIRASKSSSVKPYKGFSCFIDILESLYYDGIITLDFDTGLDEQYEKEEEDKLALDVFDAFFSKEEKEDFLNEEVCEMDEKKDNDLDFLNEEVCEMDENKEVCDNHTLVKTSFIPFVAFLSTFLILVFGLIFEYFNQ